MERRARSIAGRLDEVRRLDRHLRRPLTKRPDCTSLLDRDVDSFPVDRGYPLHCCPVADGRLVFGRQLDIGTGAA